MKSIGFFVSENLRSKYRVLNNFSQKLHEAFLSIGIESRIIPIHPNTPDFIEKLLDRPTDFTIMVNGGSPVINGAFLCDLLKIPHVGFLVDAPYYFFRHLSSRYNIFTSVDRSVIPFYQKLGFNEMLFMPHAVDGALTYDPQASRPYDVVMISSCIDYEGRRAEWPRMFPREVCQVIEGAVDRCLADRRMPPYVAFIRALEKHELSSQPIDFQEISLTAVLSAIEYYLRGKDRIELVRSIKSGQVHVFGSADVARGWKELLHGCANVVVHEEIPFESTYEVMKQSKIVLNSCPTIPDGGHERLFAALACGAQVVSTASAYLNEQFNGTGAILEYLDPCHPALDQAIRESLDNPLRQRAAVEKGREVVMRNHTWQRRAEQLVAAVEPLIKKWAVQNEGKI